VLANQEMPELPITMDVEACLIRSSKGLCAFLDSNTLGSFGLEHVVTVAAAEVT
jgi:hypothetical protein